MCVLTYIPVGSDSYFLTNNRDENPARERAMEPKEYHINGKKLMFPKDPKGGGTWIACHENQSMVLLNGGHTIHTSKPPYRQSRGKVILDFVAFDSVTDFYKRYDFEGIEPFTLVIVGDEISEIRWDEQGKTLNRFGKSQPKIWSSVTLYTPDVIKKRELWFQEFLSQPNATTKENILKFHAEGGDGDEENSLKMKRGEIVKTLGISQIIADPSRIDLTYFALD